jgi:arabinogalactan endo-1,4-beta-galactosidase
VAGALTAWSFLAAASMAAERQTQFLVGADLSALATMEQHGAVYRDGGATGDLIRILRTNGFNAARLRLFVNPDRRDVVTQDLPYTIALARRAKSAGMYLLLDLHYSDTWADPGNQRKPAAWAILDFDALERRVEDYTRETVAEMIRAGARPDMVQVGNEISQGLLWPDGQIWRKDRPDPRWEPLARLVKAGIRGVRATEAEIPVMLHLACGGDAGSTRQFLQAMKDQGVSFDVIGQSYYPWWHGPFRDLESNLAAMAKEWGKDIVVVETAYPHGDPARWSQEKNMDWPVTPEGQAAFLSQVASAVHATPRGRGVFYWFPESVPVAGLHGWYGGSAALFDEHGDALPGLRAWVNPAHGR